MLTIVAPLPEQVRYHKVGVTKNNLAPIILQSTKKLKVFKKFQNSKVLGTPPPGLSKQKFSEVPQAILEIFVFDEQDALCASPSL